MRRRPTDNPGDGLRGAAASFAGAPAVARRARPRARILAGNRLLLVALIGVFATGLAVRLDGIDAPLLGFAPERQTYDALRARIIYQADSPRVSPRERAILAADRTSVPQIEPPVLEHLAALGYRLAGAEKTWIPGLASVLFWLGGGIFLYRLARRLAPPPGPLAALCVYLFLPYAIVASRSFQPDPLMVAGMVGALLTVVRYHERPDGRRLAAAAAASALATLVKPPIPAFFLLGAFLGIALARRAGRSRSTAMFAAATLLPSLAYYAYGTVLADFLAGHTDSSIAPDLWLHRSYWRGWLSMIANVVAYPTALTPSRALAVCVALAALAAVVLRLAGGSRARGLLAGLVCGYLAFGLTFSVHVSTHPYYSLPLLPVVALFTAPLAAAAARYAAGGLVARATALAGVAFAFVAAGHQVLPRLDDPSARARARFYAAVGAAAAHTRHGIHVDPLFAAPLLYYGRVASSPLYAPTTGRDLARGQLRKELVEITSSEGPPRVLIVTDVRELSSEPELEGFVRRLPVIRRTSSFAVFGVPARELARAERA
jgi:Dolichyl-phosphate-mannose-protein mannosyltransferase